MDESIFDPDDVVDPLIGRILEGKYIIRKLLGAGGYGAVYLAEHSTTGGLIALKVLRANLLSSKGALRRFYVEGQNTHKLSHHNTVRLFDFGRTDDGIVFMAMEFVRGRTVADALGQDGRFPPTRVVHIAEQILRSLGEAHELEIVHRDIKPANIMLVDQFGEHDFVKVLDFGVSRSLDTTGAGTQGIIGTPQYMAPEMWEGGKIDGRADLYAVGCMMYQMLAGRLPWQIGVEREHVLQWASAHVLQAPPELLAIAPKVCSPELASVVMRLMAKAPSDRPPTAADALALLAATREERTTAQFAAVEPTEALQTGPDIPRDTLRRPDKTSVDALAGLHAATMSLDEAEAARARAQAAGSGRRRGVLYASLAAGVAAVALLAVAVTGGDDGATGRDSTPTIAESTPSAETERTTPAKPAAKTLDEPTDFAEAKADEVHETPEPAAVVAETKLVLESEPPRAAVFDAAGKTKLGETPWDVPPKLQTGERELIVRLSGFRSSRVLLKAPTGGPVTRQRVMLRPLPRVKIVSTPKGATVQLAGTETELGRTPMTWRVPAELVEQLEAGETLAVELSHRGYEPTKAELNTTELLKGYTSLDERLTRIRVRTAPKAGTDEPKDDGSGWSL